MARKRRRSVGKIDRLPPELRDTVEQMLLNGFYYKDIVAFLQESGVALSEMSVCRYAEKYIASVQQVRIANENFRMMADEVDKYPNLDTTEVIARLASNHVMNALTNMSAEDCEDIQMDKLMKEASALIRAVTYKRKTDLQNKTDTETALDANQTLLSDILGKKHPALYQQVISAISQERELLQGTEEHT